MSFLAKAFLFGAVLCSLLAMTVISGKVIASSCDCLCYKQHGSCGYAGAVTTAVEDCTIPASSQAACESASCSSTHYVVYDCNWTY